MAAVPRNREQFHPAKISVTRVILMIGIATAFLIIPGCSEPPAEDTRQADSAPAMNDGDIHSTQASEQDLVLRMIIWPGYAPDRFVEEFEEHVESTYGRKIHLQVNYTDGGANDFYDPIRNKTVDLVTITHHLFKDEQFGYISKGMLLPLDLDNIPNFSHLTPSLQNAEFLASENRVYGAPVCQGPYGLAYNADVFSSAPASWDVFWDPAYSGNYTLAANEYMYNINITALSMGYPSDQICSYDVLNNAEFKQKLRHLVVNAKSFWVGAEKPEDLSGLALGAIWGDAIGPLNEQGERWAMATPEEGIPYWIDCNAITWALADKPFLKQIAEEWINMALAQEYQVENVLRDLSQTPVVTNLEGVLTQEEAQRLMGTAGESSKELRLPQPTVNRRDRNGLKVLWNEAIEGTAAQR